MLTHYSGSTGTLKATITDASGNAVTGSTVTVSITDWSGSAVASGSMVEVGSTGVHTYTIAHGLLSEGRKYFADVLAINGSNRRRARVTIHDVLDTD